MIDRDAIKKTAALQIVFDLASHVAENSGAGRLRGKCEELVQWSAGRLMELRPRLTAVDVARVQAMKDRWGTAVGWNGRPRHVCTVVSFLIAVMTDHFRDETKMVDNLTAVFDYYDRAGNCPIQAGWAGTLAYLKFEKIMEAGI